MTQSSAVQREPTDLLLINGSNYGNNAIFPYAFVQVSALARRHGLKVRRLELLPFARSGWEAQIRHALRSVRPRMVGAHLRQADSQYVQEYVPLGRSARQSISYFPVHNTEDILDVVRSETDAPTILGGFGFTTHAQQLMTRLKPDFGVVGEPDALFANFDRVLSKAPREALSDVANLIVGGKSDQAAETCEAPSFNARQFFGPLDDTEYNDEIFGELTSFYAALGRPLSISGFGHVDVAVEIMRGCPCSCYFCTEPAVKGRKIRTRSLDAVMAEVEFLASKHVHSIFFVCSELNIGGMEFPLQLAERMLRFNETRPGREVFWKAYSMPRPGMSRENLKILMRSGYHPGWNEFPSFDDDNLKRCKMPYRSSHALEYLANLAEVTQDPAYRAPPLELFRFDMFLGNAYATAQSISTTLSQIDEHGLAQFYKFGAAVTATRVYDVEGKLSCGTKESVFSINPKGRQGFDATLPSFYYSEYLLQTLGGEAEIERFFDFVSSRFLTTAYSLQLSCVTFLLRSSTPEAFGAILRQWPQGFVCAAMMRDNLASQSADAGSAQESVLNLVEDIWRTPSIANLQRWLSLGAMEREEVDLALGKVLQLLFRLNRSSFARIIKLIGLPEAGSAEFRSLTPYRVMRVLYSKFTSLEDLRCQVAHGCVPSATDQLQLEYLLYEFGVEVHPIYGHLLFSERAETPANAVPAA